MGSSGSQPPTLATFDMRQSGSELETTNVETFAPAATSELLQLVDAAG